ncbi:MAG: hypothetical protein VE98_C0001G0432 [candidate division Kazan bacterium GW2011_GWA1_50_15]|uniref:DUF4044 domain-containing protein n=1 Tax=candidate division Kazan bacterium GW2011_GWA1_50_15 TaxID=1620412 RepID=A0A0G4BAI9_UNCK3|nr:MAG: hypothetical protein VE98_C0001G0432 [candidate division Kazan bacterium GW2011_GWA1_50_15]
METMTGKKKNRERTVWMIILIVLAVSLILPYTISLFY